MHRSSNDQCTSENDTALANIKASVHAQLVKQLGHEPGEELVAQVALQALAQLAWKEGGKQQFSRDEAHQFWQEAKSGSNQPEHYAGASIERSRFLHGLIANLQLDTPTILEIGCNAGRNLAYLYDHGYHKLTGIEISARAVTLLRERYPQMATAAQVYTAPVEDVIQDFGDGEFDIVFSMAVLVHIHPESDWVMSEIARISGSFLITIEDEKTITMRHFRRNYREIFEEYGMRQTSEYDVSWIEGLQPYVARVFARRK